MNKFSTLPLVLAVALGLSACGTDKRRVINQPLNGTNQQGLFNNNIQQQPNQLNTTSLQQGQNLAGEWVALVNGQLAIVRVDANGNIIPVQMLNQNYYGGYAGGWYGGMGTISGQAGIYIGAQARVQGSIHLPGLLEILAGIGGRGCKKQDTDCGCNHGSANHGANSGGCNQGGGSHDDNDNGKDEDDDGTPPGDEEPGDGDTNPPQKIAALSRISSSGIASGNENVYRLKQEVISQDRFDAINEQTGERAEFHRCSGGIASCRILGRKLKMQNVRRLH